MPRYRFPVEAGVAGPPASSEAVLAHFDALGLPRQGITVTQRDDTLTLAGPVPDGATRERLVLAAGNMRGIGAVKDRLAAAATPGLLESLGGFARLPAGSAAAASTAGTVHDARSDPDAQLGAGGSLFHTVAPGETLESIAARHYDDAAAARRILEANAPMLAGPAAIAPGLVLRLPQA